MEVPQAREPEAQGRRAQHRRQQLALGSRQCAHLSVGLQQRGKAYRIGCCCLRVHGPVVQAHGEVEQPAVDAGEIEVEDAGQLFTLEQGVVAEQIRVDGAAWQRRIGRRGGDMVLVGQFAADQCALRRVQKGLHHRHGGVPPVQAAQVGQAFIEVAALPMQLRQRGSKRCAVCRRRRQLAPSRQSVHHGRWFPLHRVQDLPQGVGHGLRHRQSALREVAHQIQIKRQLLGTQALEQREHVVGHSAVALGADEIVGVFDAAGTALHRLQFAQRQLVQELLRLGKADFGIDGHGSVKGFARE